MPYFVPTLIYEPCIGKPYERGFRIIHKLTRLKPRDVTRAGAQQKQGSMQPFTGRGMSRGPKKLET